MKKFVDSLHAVHTSRLQCQYFTPGLTRLLTSITLRRYYPRSMGSWAEPPANRYTSSGRSNTSRFRAEGFECQSRVCDRICRAEESGVRYIMHRFLPLKNSPTKTRSSDKLLDFFQYHIHSADDHYVRWKWAVGSVAMWDNR
jgi:hypothetical protein